MAWSANLVNAAGVEFNIVATVQFINSVTNETITRPVPGNNLTPYTLANYCAAQIALLNQRDQLIGNLKAGPIALPS